MYSIFINDRCIGCGICSIKCPIQSIYGILDSGFKIVEAECIGCRLCVFVCPVTCIDVDLEKFNIRLNKFVIKQKLFIKESVFFVNSVKLLHFDFNNNFYVRDKLINYRKQLF